MMGIEENIMSHKFGYPKRDLILCTHNILEAKFVHKTT